MANAWIEHVKAYRKKHPKLSYGEAMKAAKSSYKPKKGMKGKGVKELCQEGIKSKADARKWVLKNHPDKGGNAELFKRIHPSIQDANRTGKYCPSNVPSGLYDNVVPSVDPYNTKRSFATKVSSFFR